MYPHLQQPWRALAHGLVMWEGRATQAAEILNGVGRGEDEEAVKVLRGEEGQGQGTLNRARAKVGQDERRGWRNARSNIRTWVGMGGRDGTFNQSNIQAFKHLELDLIRVRAGGAGRLARGPRPVQAGGERGA